MPMMYAQLVLLIDYDISDILCTAGVFNSFSTVTDNSLLSSVFSN